MYTTVKIICPTCKEKFLPKSERNIYCCRRCFKKNHYERKRLEELNNKKFPIFFCPSCGKKIELDFDPIKDERKWAKFCCPSCSTLMINVWEEIKTQDISMS